MPWRTRHMLLFFLQDNEASLWDATWQWFLQRPMSKTAHDAGGWGSKSFHKMSTVYILLWLLRISLGGSFTESLQAFLFQSSWPTWHHRLCSEGRGPTSLTSSGLRIKSGFYYYIILSDVFHRKRDKWYIVGKHKFSWPWEEGVVRIF